MELRVGLVRSQSRLDRNFFISYEGKSSIVNLLVAIDCLSITAIPLHHYRITVVLKRSNYLGWGIGDWG
jgi:hypothetical protein